MANLPDSLTVLNIDLQSEIGQKLVFKQSDSGHYLSIYLSYNGTAYNLENSDLFLYVIKPDGKPMFLKCEIINGQQGHAGLELTDNLLAVVGCIQAEFKIVTYDGVEVIKSRTFPIQVLPMIYNSEAVESTSEFTALVDALKDVNDAKSLIENISDRIGWPYPPDVPYLTIFDWLRLFDMPTLINLILSRGDKITLDKIWNKLNQSTTMFKPPGNNGQTFQYKKVDGIDYVRVICIGGGAGGDGGPGNTGLLPPGTYAYAGAGGGAGYISEAIIDISHLAAGTEIPCAVGGGGLGGTGGLGASQSTVLGGNGGTGGTTSFGEYLSAAGGRRALTGNFGHSMWLINGASIPASDLPSFIGRNGSFPGQFGANATIGTGQPMVSNGSGGYSQVKVSQDGSPASTGNMGRGEGGYGYGAGGGGGGGADQNSSGSAGDGGAGGRGAPGLIIIQPA